MTGLLYLPEDHPDVVNAKGWIKYRKDGLGFSQYKAQFNGGEAFEPDGYLTDYYSREAKRLLRTIKANRFLPH